MKQSKDDKVIHLNGNWAIEGDAQAVTLYRKRINRKGKLDFYAEGYFPNLQQLFNRLIDIETNSAKTLELMVTAIEDLKRDIFMFLERLRADSQADLDKQGLVHRPGIRPPREDGT